mgnify:CR=1 FL=1
MDIPNRHFTVFGGDRADGGIRLNPTIVYQPRYSRYRTEVTMIGDTPYVRMFLTRNGKEYEVPVTQSKL